jgi:molybdopterin-guanine dinucleotide biosynthesis protein B
MISKKIPVLSFVGRANTGKTTLIEKLITVFKIKGLKIAVIKHHHRDFEIDIPGKDTYRLKKSGACAVIISSPEKIALVQDTKNDLTINEIISKYKIDADVIFTEGYKKAGMPKIEVYQERDGAPPICIDDKNLIAIVSDSPIQTHAPVFSRDDIEGIIDFLLSHFRLHVAR